MAQKLSAKDALELTVFSELVDLDEVVLVDQKENQGGGFAATNTSEQLRDFWTKDHPDLYFWVLRKLALTWENWDFARAAIWNQTMVLNEETQILEPALDTDTLLFVYNVFVSREMQEAVLKKPTQRELFRNALARLDNLAVEHNVSNESWKFYTVFEIIDLICCRCTLKKTLWGTLPLGWPEFVVETWASLSMLRTRHTTEMLYKLMGAESGYKQHNELARTLVLNFFTRGAHCPVLRGEIPELPTDSAAAKATKWSICDLVYTHKRWEGKTALKFARMFSQTRDCDVMLTSYFLQQNNILESAINSDTAERKKLLRTIAWSVLDDNSNEFICDLAEALDKHILFLLD